MPALLLHSLTFYSDLIGSLTALPENPNIVEIGSESGEMSELLATKAAQRQGHLTVVEPYPSERLNTLAANRSNVSVVVGHSPHALEGLATAGLYVIDGDHNYAVVHAEISDIFGGGDSKDSIAVLHDVGWPSGRRDQYYAPHLLPSGSVHEHSFERGAVLDSVELAPPGRGFRGEGAFAFAVREGGPRNGVLTAIEDAIGENPGLDLLLTPLVFGLGVMGWRSSTVWRSVAQVMDPYIQNPTLAAMERNRLELYLRVLDHHDRYRGSGLLGVRGLVERGTARATDRRRKRTDR